MPAHPPVMLFEPDAALRASLQFALGLLGFHVEPRDGGDADPDASGAGCLVIDERLGGRDGLALLGRLRDGGCSAPAIVLATNPSATTRRRIADAGALLVEKPLLGDALPQVLHRLLTDRKAA